MLDSLHPSCTSLSLVLNQVGWLDLEWSTSSSHILYLDKSILFRQFNLSFSLHLSFCLPYFWSFIWGSHDGHYSELEWTTTTSGLAVSRCREVAAAVFTSIWRLLWFETNNTDSFSMLGLQVDQALRRRRQICSFLQTSQTIFQLQCRLVLSRNINVCYCCWRCAKLSAILLTFFGYDFSVSLCLLPSEIPVYWISSFFSSVSKMF